MINPQPEPTNKELGEIEQKCACKHYMKDHMLYTKGGKNKNGSPFVCTADNCNMWSYCDLGVPVASSAQHAPNTEPTIPDELGANIGLTLSTLMLAVMGARNKYKYDSVAPKELNDVLDEAYKTAKQDLTKLIQTLELKARIDEAENIKRILPIGLYNDGNFYITDSQAKSKINGRIAQLTKQDKKE